jgi:uncharacterized protein Veg
MLSISINVVNPEKVATLGAQDIRQRQTKQQTQHNKDYTSVFVLPFNKLFVYNTFIVL